MNREIKFRAWDNLNKIMLSWDSFKNIKFDIGDGYETGIPLEILEEKYQKQHNLIPQQFTGLHDKNGKEIYEGDIVLGRFILDDVEDYIYLSLTDMERKNQSKTFLIEDISYLYTNPIPEDIEVIGNIYENKELLTNKN